jgi:glutathione peroxidase-family protein
MAVNAKTFDPLVRDFLKFALTRYPTDYAATGSLSPTTNVKTTIPADATPLYQRLAAATGVEPGWNFHKYLVSRDGRVVAQFPSKVKPDDKALVAAIERELSVTAAKR